jgi:hypothetical protein
VSGAKIAFELVHAAGVGVGSGGDSKNAFECPL